jgi:hypothetical protein
MIRLIIVLVSLLTGAFAHAEAVQLLQPDTKFPSVLDLSDGKPALWKESEEFRASSVYYGVSPAGQGSLPSGAPRTESVRGYVRANGTYVAPYFRASRRQ